MLLYQINKHVATHTHSGPGGFFQYLLYNIPTQGFISETLEALVSGVVLSIERAHNASKLAKIYYKNGELLDSSINRSPTSYLKNPEKERAKYEYNTDKTMHLLRFDDSNGKPLGMLNWFAVHGTSMNNSNHLISSDNKGYAAILFEQTLNPPSTLPGKGEFVAIFAQANEGDVSPNTAGPRCIDTGLPCDEQTSTCNGSNEKCIAFGPGEDMFESTKIIGAKQTAKALELFDSASKDGVQLRGKIKFIHQHIDITNQYIPVYESAQNLLSMYEAEAKERRAAQLKRKQSSQVDRRRFFKRQSAGATGALSNSTAASLPITSRYEPAKILTDEKGNNVGEYFKTCNAALGYSFAAGTTDGPGAFDFTQGSTNSTQLWNAVRNLLRKPSDELRECHRPKPIVLATGEMDFPYLWHPRIVPTQIFSIGQLTIVGLPGEFTTMSGRRVREAVRDELRVEHDGKAPNNNNDDTIKDGQEPIVVLSGLSNIYTSYVTTIEEYDNQRYEGGSTLFGPHTLQAYVQQFAKLAKVLAEDGKLEDNKLSPPNLLDRQITLKPSVIFDSSPRGKKFGQVIVDVKSNSTYKCGDLISVTFASANPRNDLKLEESFLYVELYDLSTKNWVKVESDASWNTKFIWKRTNSMMGTSEAIIEWKVPTNCKSGIYRITHFGASKNIFQSIKQFSGTSSSFKLVSSTPLTPEVELAFSSLQQANTEDIDASKPIDNSIDSIFETLMPVRVKSSVLSRQTNGYPKFGFLSNFFKHFG